MNITGIVVYASPDGIDGVRARLEEMRGVEIHAVDANGKMVVTVEQAEGGESVEAFDRIAGIPGVLSAALAYHHFDPGADRAA